MTGFDNHKVVTSKNLSDWLYNVASDHGASIWRGGTANNITLTKTDIVNGVWATYSANNNTTGIYISGYSVGDGKSGYAANQNVIAADIAYRNAGGVTPPEDDHVFIVCPEDDKDSENVLYIDNTVGAKVTFAVITDLPHNSNRITVTPQNTSLTSAGSITSSGMWYNNYHYTFDVTLNSLNTGSTEVEEYFEVSQVGISSDDTINNRTVVVTVIIRPTN